MARDDSTTSYTYDVMGRKSTEAEYTSVYATFKGFFYVGVSQYVDRQIVGINHLLMYSYTSYEYDSEMRVTKVKENGDETASYTYVATRLRVLSPNPAIPPYRSTNIRTI